MSDDPISGGGWSLAGDPEGAAAPPPPGERYQLRNLIGRGGMGVVRVAHDRVVGRDVAIKELPAETALDPRHALRLTREAAITGRLDHPSIVAIYDIGQYPDGRPFYTMRLIRGRTLAQALGGTPDAAGRQAFLRSLLAATEAIAAAHRAGMVHRDLKPANILLGPFGETQVVDWGLAAPTAAAAEAWADLPGSTTPGRVGTPGYMAPEQGQSPDPRHDVYSLGVILRELLTGGSSVLPEGTPPPDLLAVARHATGPFELRYPNAQAMAEDLAAWFEGRRVGVHPYRASELFRRLLRLWRVPLLVGLAGVVAVTGVTGLGIWRVTVAKDRAVASEVVATEARKIAEQQLARTRVEQAVGALGKSDRGRAEGLAVTALNYEDNPTARGVLAAYGLAERPRMLREEPGPTCDWSVMGEGFLICGGQARVARWEGGALRWRQPRGAIGGDLVGGGLVLWNGADRIALLDPATGEVLAENNEAARPWMTISSPRKTFVEGRLWPPDIHHPLPPCTQLQSTSVGVALASICTDGILLVGPPEDPTRLRTQTGLTGDLGPSILAWVGEDRLVVGGLRGDLWLLSARTGEVLHRITTDLGTISRFSIHSNLIAVSGSRGGIGLWDALSGSWLGEIPAQNLPSFRWTSSGELEVFSAGMLRRWSPGGRTLIRGQVGEGIADVVASPDGRRIAVGTGGGKVHVYRREDGAVLEQYSLDSLVIKGMSFLPGGQELVVTTVKAGKSWLLSGGTARQLGTMRAHRRLTVLPTGELFATDLIEGLVRYAAPGAAPDRLFLGATYLDLEAEPDGRHILLLDEHDNILRYDALTRQLHRLFSASNVRSVAGTGSLVAVTRPDEVLLTTSSGQILHRLSTGLPDVRLTDVSISPHGPRIAAGSDDGRAFVWDGESGKLLAILPGHSDRVSTLEFCSDHNLVTGSWDHSFRIWDLELLETDPAALQDGIFRDAGLPIP